jgi:hypothetical protein
MPAAKTAAEPALRDLAAEIQRQVSRAQGELADCRRRLGELRSQREQLLSAPLHRDDLAPELKRHIEKHAIDAIDVLRLSVQELRDRTGPVATTAPETVAVYSPFERKTLPEVLALVLDADIVVERILQSIGELDGKIPAGLPLTERRAAVADLDKQIAAAAETESGLIQGLQAAGVKAAMPGDPAPEPVPGERRMIDGRLQEWATFTGRDYGWWPVSESEAA